MDVLPTFAWNSLIHERWFKHINLYHTLSILDSSRHVVCERTHIFDNEYELTSLEWSAALNVFGNSYYVSIGLASDIDLYWDDYYCYQLFDKPFTYENKAQILPNEWGFEGRYYFENEGIKTSEIVKNDLTITTSRLRCGYIENSYIVLSPRREGAGRSYFELNFNKPVYSFVYSVCLWSGIENLDGLAVMQIKDKNGDWHIAVDLKDDIKLTIKSDVLKRYVQNTPDGIYGIRFETTATATGSSNKERLCIDDLVFSTLSGDKNNSYIYLKYSKTHA